MPIFLIANWRYFAIAGAIIAVFFTGMHYQSLVDSHRADALVQAQEVANAKAQAELDKRAKTAELELAAERTKSADLAEQWETERNAQAHTVCTLTPATIRLLRSASSN